MALQFFKPNQKGSGAAISISFNSKGDKKGVFFELIKQVSWDDATKKGKFGGGAKILSKFNTTEIAQFIDVIERGADFEKALYHLEMALSKDELREYLKFALSHVFTAWYSESIKEAKEYRERKEAEEASKRQNPAKAPVTKAKSVEEFVELVAEETESDDVPF